MKSGWGDEGGNAFWVIRSKAVEEKKKKSSRMIGQTDGREGGREFEGWWLL